MCGIAAIAGTEWSEQELRAMRDALRHRGPDDAGLHVEPGRVGLAHRRLSIIDLSADGRQPMRDEASGLQIVFNGEIYNYLELRRELGERSFRTRTDTEVLLAAFARWGEHALDRLAGMFAFVVWDDATGRLWAVRDRFGVKPLFFHERADGTLLVASEVKALHAAGVPRKPDETAWATYLTHGASDLSPRTFWKGIAAVPPGHLLTWKNGRTTVASWYDLADRVDDEDDPRDLQTVEAEYREGLEQSVRMRFRSDVPVGINLSGGLDSSLLLGLVHAVQDEDAAVRAFTFVTGDASYDELPWVERMLQRTRHPLTVCRLEAADVPELAASVTEFADEPFGGLPTLAYAHLFERARAEGTIVILDGQGMDEQFGGYDYYARSLAGHGDGIVQGTRGRPCRPDCLTPAFRALAEAPGYRRPFQDPLRNLQYRDLRYTKIPRALRFNDRVSMRSSVELREPFLDHHLVELALRQPVDRKIKDGTTKWLPRRLSRTLLPASVQEAPKRPLQTPQREWLRGPLADWAGDLIDVALARVGQRWLDPAVVRSVWSSYLRGEADNSFYVWQWVSIGLAVSMDPTPRFDDSSLHATGRAITGSTPA